MPPRHLSDAISRRRKRGSDAPVPAESSTRIKRAGSAGEDLRDSVQASLTAALNELDSLELPVFDPDSRVQEPPERMPKGMPPLPFQLQLPSNMPPLPPVTPPSPADSTDSPQPAPLSVPGNVPSRQLFSTRLITLTALAGLLLLLLAAFWHGR